MKSIKINADKLSIIEKTAMSKILGGSDPGTETIKSEANDRWCIERCGAPQGPNNTIATKSKW